MTRKTQDAFEGVFSYLRNYMSALSPTVVLTDFEQAMQNDTLIYCVAKLHNCGVFFHYIQAVYREMLRMHTAAVMQMHTAAVMQMHTAAVMQMHTAAVMQKNMKASKAGRHKPHDPGTCMTW